MRTRLLPILPIFPILAFVCSCNEESGLAPGAEDAAAQDGRMVGAADLPEHDLGGTEGVESGRESGMESGRESGMESGPIDGVVDRAAGDLAGNETNATGPADGRGEVATVDGPAEETAPGCEGGALDVTGTTLEWMADQCSWASPGAPSARAASIALAGTSEAMSFRVRVDIDPEAYLHQGYVSVPSLAEVGPLSDQGMEVVGPSAGTARGQYFFDLRWANQVAPREGMTITLTTSFAFACSPAMSRTIDTTTTAELVLCRSPAGVLAWTAAGGPCDCRAGAPVDAGTDAGASLPLRWRQIQVASGFPARMAHVALVFEDKMWILGGQASDGSDLNDVWSSSDGGRWSLATASAAWSPRNLHRGVVFQDKMWIIDGVRKSDVWSSDDGANWTKVIEPAAFPARYAGQVVAFADKMWIIGGYGTNGEPMNDVWSSGDGKAWTLAVASAPWAARDLHTCVVANGKIWILDGERLGDVWTSSDGIHWEQVTQVAGFPARMSHSSVFYQGNLWILGGYGTGGSPIDDVWMSADGASWSQQAAHAPWGPRNLSAAVVFQNKAWLLGGSDGSRRLNDVWTME